MSAPEGAGEPAAMDEQASPWEWVIAALSTLLVLGAIGFMGYEALAERPSPPEIEIVTDSIVDTGRGYVVEFRAHNHSNSTAASLVVEGELTSDTGTVETSQVTIDYVPARGTQAGGLFFREDPRRHTLEIRPMGYERP